MTSTILIMIKGKYTPKLKVWDTPPNDLVWEIFIEMMVIPKEMFDSREKFGSILLRPMRRNIVDGKVIDNIGKLRRGGD